MEDLLKILKSKEYRFVFLCPLSKDAVRVVYNPAYLVKKTKETRRLIKESWEKQRLKALYYQHPFFNTRGYFLRSWSFNKDKNILYLKFGSTSFKELVGTYKENPEILKRFGRDYVSYALSTFGTILTGDKKLLFVKRGDKVISAQHSITPVGGFLERLSVSKRNYLSHHIFSEFQREIIEELGIPYDSIIETVITGIVLKREHGDLPRITFHSKVNLKSEEILKMFKGKSDFENTDIFFVKPTYSAIKIFLAIQKNSIYWTTKASLLSFIVMHKDVIRQ